MQISWTRLPFRYRTTQEFESGLMDLISRAFYERLPVAGFETREEQIYTAYRIARAMTAGKTFLAEAGTGTGKTFAYLIPAVCHARRTGKPVVIACATGVLQSQLADPGGDAETLSGLMDLAIDARLARNPRQYLCELKVDALAYTGGRKKGLTRLRQWAQTSKRGERSEVPDLPDELWDMVAWDESLPCDTCKRRGFCRMVRAREHYRNATDLVVCCHDLFFQDLWSRAERRAAGIRPLLPAYSGVVLDEGHRAPDVARDTAGRALDRVRLERTLKQAEGAVGPATEYLPHLMAAIRATEPPLARFWQEVTAAATPSGTERWHVARTAALLEAARPLAGALEHLQDKIAMVEDLAEEEIRVRFYTLQFRLEAAAEALEMLMGREGDTVLFAEAPGTPEAVLWAVPRRVDLLLQQELFSRKIPVVLTSATLASGGSFDYLQRALGAPDAGHASAGTPFDFARQALVYMPSAAPADTVAHLVEVLEATGGRALILAGTPGELGALRQALGGLDLPWPILWEGDADRADLLRRFGEETRSVLAGTSFWEGIDVPGESLSCVAVLRLPFPPDDPLLAARQAEARRDGMDPFATVDVPEMALKLKQGFGRLIRTARDRGVFALLDVSFRGAPFADAVDSAFPDDAERTDDRRRVVEFLA